MVGLDTNVLVRVIVGDDASQTRAAERAFIRHARGDGVFISVVVLAEVAWVLATGYDLERAAIHHHLSRLVRTRGVIVEDLALVQDALQAFASGRGDFADYLILAKARQAGAAALLTFDRRLSREGGVNLL